MGIPYPENSKYALLRFSGLEMRIHLLRHGQTIAPAGVMLGATELALSPVGREQARILGRRIPQDIPCICSPMLRAKQTLECLEEGGNIFSELIFDKRLREINFGAWEMKTFAEIIGGGVDISGWLKYNSFTFPGGESVSGFVQRIKSVLDELSADEVEEVILLCHGGVIRTMICLALNLEPKNYLLFQVDYCSWSILDMHSEGGILKTLNR
jgi:alpha-ribazole phosphatase